MPRTIYNPDGTLTGSALTDAILWTERRGMNLVDLAKEFDTDPKELGVAVQRAKAGGAYMAKRKELIEKDMLKRDKPLEQPEKPAPVESKPQPPAPPKVKKVPPDKEKAKALLQEGANPEAVAKAAGYKSAKIMLRALGQERPSVPEKQKEELRVKCLAPAYLKS